MSAGYKNIGDVAQSSILEFQVGDAKTTFFVHAGLIEDGGIIAQRLWAQAKAGLPMMIDDCDAETFARYVDFLYTGQYAAAAPKPRCMPCDTSADSSINGKHTPEEPVTEDVPNDSEDHDNEPTVEFWGHFPLKAAKKQSLYGGAASRKSGQKPAISLREHAWETFKNLTLPAPPVATKPPTYKTVPNSDPWEDHSEVLLSHAKLHAFAIVYDITDLQHLSINRLHKALIKFTAHPECAGDIARLLHYTYTELPHTSDRTLEDVVVRYVACHVETLAGNPVFQTTMRDCNEAAVNLVQHLVRRLDT